MQSVRLRHDPVLWVLGVLACVCVLWLVLGRADYVTQIRFFWMMQVPCDAALCVLAWRVHALATGPSRRFWGTLSASALLWTIGDCVQSYLVLTHPATLSVNGGVVQTSCFTTGAAVLLVVMLIHPSVARTGRRRAAFWLDAATTLAGGAVLAWCFSINPADAGKVDLVTTLLGVGVLLTAFLAAVKMILSGNAPATLAAAVPMILAAVIQGAAMFAVPTTQGSAFEPWQMVIRVLPSLLLLAGPRIQRLQARNDPGTFASRTPRSYSLLPYVSIASTFVVELVVLPGGVNVRLWGVVIGAMVVTLLVVGRQLVAFHDNAALIGQLREQERRLFEQASYDGLTRLANRSMLVAEMSRALDGTRPKTGLALLLIDLDDFKTVNDTLGHPAGDLLLTRAADVLRTSTDAEDLVARLGGDEFAVMLRDVDLDRASAVADRILGNLGRPIHVDGHELVVRASVGLAMAEDGDDQHSLLRNADIALYEAKDRGKGVCARYAPELGVRIQQAATLATQLRQAIDGGQLFLQYQPIVRLSVGGADQRGIDGGIDGGIGGGIGGGIVGAEALLRWRHPEQGLIAPAEFIPVAERTGLIVPIGRWVLREAVRQAAAWRREYDRPDFVMSANVAGRQLLEPGFIDDVAAALADADLPPACLTVEVTENAVLSDGVAIEALHRLRDLGVNVALDDFGTAASSLGLLLTCPVTTLKLDRSFVESITTVSRQAAVARAVIEMATALELQAVAEGVETVEQAELLGRLSYRYAQGYLFSRPVDADAFSRGWLAPQLTSRTDEPQLTSRN
jgi:diguanylate cyclase (GGDEF)-like protein